MPLPEGYLPRDGDILIFHAAVRHDLETWDEYIHVTKPGSEHTNLLLPVSAIVGLYCRSWKVGERVVHPPNATAGIVVAVPETDKEWVWVRFDANPNGQGAIIHANSLLPEPTVDVGPEDFGLPSTAPPATGTADDEIKF